MSGKERSWRSRTRKGREGEVTCWEEGERKKAPLQRWVLFTIQVGAPQDLNTTVSENKSPQSLLMVR